MGTMRFLDGSHRLGQLGRRSADDLLACYPRLSEKATITEPFTYRPGDSTVNDLRLIHSAGPNQTDEIRWGYTCMYFPEDALYTGIPHRYTEDLGLEAWQPFDHPRFRVVGEP
jgi:hypothetical protein